MKRNDEALMTNDEGMTEIRRSKERASEDLFWGENSGLHGSRGTGNANAFTIWKNARPDLVKQ